jgi:hypothetical protein
MYKEQLFFLNTNFISFLDRPNPKSLSKLSSNWNLLAKDNLDQSTTSDILRLNDSWQKTYVFIKSFC